MAEAIIKFISTTSEKVNSIPVTVGNLIFVKDDRTIYLDTDVRTSYQQIICIDTEEQRAAIEQPIVGFYFVSDTCVLWRYSNGWYKITSAPQEQIVFRQRDRFPSVGMDNILYVDGTHIYRWIDGEYKEMATGSLWQEI